jgi:acyl-CoA thioester hydrolase
MKPHEHQVRIYYDTTDAGGVVYHAAYLAMAEHARTEALRAGGLPHAQMQAEHGVSFMVRRVEISYLQPARLDDLLTIYTHPTACTGATVTLRQRFARGETELVVMDVTLFCVKTNGAPARIPARWRAALIA